LLGRGTKRVAKSYQLIETRDDAVLRAEIHDGFVFGREAQIAERINKECGAAADFIAQHGNTRTGMT